jgi:hypothetical protein
MVREKLLPKKMDRCTSVNIEKSISNNPVFSLRFDRTINTIKLQETVARCLADEAFSGDLQSRDIDRWHRQLLFVTELSDPDRPGRLMSVDTWRICWPSGVPSNMEWLV